MKKILVIIFILQSLVIYAQTPNLKLASDIWPPFTDIKTEEALAFDLVQHALERIDIESEFLITDFNSVMSGIKDGTYQGSSAFWKNEEREKFLIYSDAYLENQLILLGRKGSNVNISSITELAGQKIGLVKGYAYSDSLSMVEDLQITYSESDQANLEHLLSNDIDFILVDAILIQYMLKFQINDVSALLEFGTKPLIIRSLHVALNKTVPNAEDIIQKLNKEFKSMLADGSYNEILHLDWILADIDDDGVMELVFTGDKVGTNEPTYAYNVHPGTTENSEKAYYLNGVKYESWDAVPAEYKQVPVKVTGVPANSVGISINF